MGSSITKLLLTEGKNDEHVIVAIWNKHVGGHIFDIQECQSDQGVFEAAEIHIKAKKKSVIGIVIDADNNYQARWQSLSDHMQNFGIDNFPESPSEQGTIINQTASKPRIGIWMMPNNISDGMLEHFCSQIAPQAGIQFAKKCVEQAQLEEHSSFKDTHHQKAIVHTYLAWQDEPGLPLGLSIKRNNLNSQQPLAKSFALWLERLFLPENHTTD